jgi:hypothetical protein
VPQAPLHILFSAAAAGALRQALASIERNDEVICLHDNLSVGPVDTLDPDMRLRWLATACRLQTDEWNWFPDEVRQFWSRAVSDSRVRVLWFTRNSARELAGLVAFLDRSGAGSFTVADGTDCKVRVKGGSGSAESPILSLGELAPNQIQTLLDTDRPLSAERLEAFRERWAALRSDGALLRVVLGAGELSSVPIEFFDDALLSACTCEWQRASRVIGTAMFSTVAGRLHAVDDLFLCSRLLALLERGLLEAREDTGEWSGDRIMQQAHVRLRSRQT